MTSGRPSHDGHTNGDSSLRSSHVKDTGSRRDAPLVIRSEFADVEISIDFAGHSPRFRIVDLRSNKVANVSPIELESIVWCDDIGREDLIKNAMSRW